MKVEKKNTQPKIIKNVNSQNSAKNSNPKDLLILEKYGERKIQFILTFGFFTIISLFYWSQNLFFVNDLNDFGEYFNRAEKWVNNEWDWGGGIDKLLSFVYYFPIKWFQHDFLKIYHVSVLILNIILFLACALFVLRKNEALPAFGWKLLSLIFLLTMPFFMIESLTIDPSFLFAALLILFFATYNVSYLGVVAFLVALSRPEWVIIVPIYVLMFVIDTKKRKNILINFITFLVLIISFRYIEAKYFNYAVSATGIQAIDTSVAAGLVSGGTGLLIVNVLKSVFYVPVYSILYGLHVTQNYVLFILYLIGFFFSLGNRRMFIFHAVLLAYAMAFYTLCTFNPIDLGLAWKYGFSISKLINDSYAVVNGRDMTYHILGHSRYFLFLYPSIAIFIVSGCSVILNFIRKSYFQQTEILSKKQKNIESKGIADNSIKGTIIKIKTFLDRFVNPFNLPSPNIKSLLVLGSVVLFLVIHNLYTYSKASKPYTFKYQLNEEKYMNDYYKLGFEIRKRMNPDDIVFAPAFCICNVSFNDEFTNFAGTRFLLIPLCENCNDQWVIGHSYPLTSKEIEKDIPNRAVIFDRTVIEYNKTFNPEMIKKINNLFIKYDLNMLDSIGIRFIIFNKPIDHKGIEAVAKSGEWNLYMNNNIK